MDYATCYDIAVYINKINRGFFSNKDIACYAYEYKCALDHYKKNKKLSKIIKDMIEILKDDGSERCCDWLQKIMEL